MLISNDEFFEVEYSYYQYNSGAADNGYYTQSIRFNNEHDAFVLANRINENVKARKEERFDDMDNDLNHEYIPWDGYFLGARAYRCTRESIL